jgi:hypothetical protein
MIGSDGVIDNFIRRQESESCDRVAQNPRKLPQKHAF